MTQYLISRDDRFRAAVQTDDGKIIAFPAASGGKIDGGNPVEIDGFHVLSDDAGIVERSHLGDPTLERIVTEFSNKTLPL